MIADEDIHKALDYLARSAVKAAQARANREYIKEFLKSKLAILQNGLNEGSEGMRERVARAHPEYLALLEGYREAIQADEECRHYRDAAQAKIQAFQTFSANARGKL